MLFIFCSSFFCFGYEYVYIYFALFLPVCISMYTFTFAEFTPIQFCCIYNVIQAEGEDCEQVWSTYSASSGGHHSCCASSSPRCSTAQAKGQASENCVGHCSGGRHVQASPLSPHHLHWQHLRVSSTYTVHACTYCL